MFQTEPNRRGRNSSMAVNYVSEATEGRNVAIAYIYCDYKDERTHSEFELLSSIVRQLTNHYVCIPAAVIQFRDKNADKKRNPTSKEWITLIEELSRPFEKTYIFIDALVDTRSPPGFVYAD